MEQVATVTVGEAIMLSLFAYFLLVVVALLAAIMIRGIVLVLASAKKTRAGRVPAATTPVQVAVSPEPAQIEDKAAHVAAIAAAIYAVVGARRLIHIGEPRPSYGWTTTGRVFHQTSHLPKRAPQR